MNEKISIFYYKIQRHLYPLMCVIAYSWISVILLHDFNYFDFKLLFFFFIEYFQRTEFYNVKIGHAITMCYLIVA